MEFLKEAIASRNIFVWIILVLLVILVLKVLKSLGKAVVFLLILVVVLFLMSQFFPGLIQPLVDFVKGGWMN
jgi:cell division protein FtsW (lipid II flippase)